MVLLLKNKALEPLDYWDNIFNDFTNLTILESAIIDLRAKDFREISYGIDFSLFKEL